MSLSDRIVILRDGKIAAQGSPRDLYERPNSVWTATFLGDANCFPVESGVERDGENPFVRIAGGARVPVIGDDASDGATRTVVVRPENCRIERQHDGRSAFIKASVKWVEYLGAVQRVRATTGETEITADIPGRGETFAQDEKVYVGWKSEHALVIGND